MRRSLRAIALLIGALGIAGCGHAACARNSDCDEGDVCWNDGTCHERNDIGSGDAGVDASDGGGQLDSGSDAAIETVDAAVDVQLDGGP
jgi:hypothetical protein